MKSHFMNTIVTMYTSFSSKGATSGTLNCSTHTVLLSLV